MARKTFDRIYTAGFIISMANSQRSVEQGVLDATPVALLPGTALGKLTANGRLVRYNPAGADGSQNFAGFLYEGREISVGTQRCTYVAREAEVNGRKLQYVLALTAPQLAAFEALAAAQQVIVRY